MSDTTRDLIRRLAKELDLYRQMVLDDCTSTHPLANEARTVLAQPEPEGPTPECVAAGCLEEAARQEPGSPIQQLLSEAGGLLTLCGRPAIEAGLKESEKYDEDHWRKDALEKLIYAAQHFRLGVYSAEELEIFENRGRAVLANWGRPAVEPEEPTDEELLRTYGLAKRDHCYEGPIDDWPKRAERAATVHGLRAVLARWPRAAIKPVPVSERLPGPEDCMDEGWAWFYTPRGDWIKAVLPVSPAYTHWLPHHALPVPATPTETNGQA